MAFPKSDNPRNQRIDMRLTKDEKDAIVKLAAIAGVTVTEFFLGLALGDKLGQKIASDGKK